MTLGERFFGWAYARRSPELEPLGAAEHRRRLLAGAAGRVLEIGAGNGLNFAHLPASVAHYVALEPNPYLYRLARQEAARNAVAISVVASSAEALPMASGSFDAVVCSLVLCTVPRVEVALAEVARVLRPGGSLHFYEHGASPRKPLRQLQAVAQPLWRLVAGGCRLTRRPLEAIETAGFSVESFELFEFCPRLSARLTAPHVIGRALRR